MYINSLKVRFHYQMLNKFILYNALNLQSRLWKCVKTVNLLFVNAHKHEKWGTVQKVIHKANRSNHDPPKHTAQPLTQ